MQRFSRSEQRMYTYKNCRPWFWKERRPLIGKFRAVVSLDTLDGIRKKMIRVFFMNEQKKVCDEMDEAAAAVFELLY